MKGTSRHKLREKRHAALCKSYARIMAKVIAKTARQIEREREPAKPT
jgi:hypothetical protein